jgi:hypothetical protein
MDISVPACPGISETGAQGVDPRYKRSLSIENRRGRRAGGIHVWMRGKPSGKLPVNEDMEVRA